MEFMNVSEILDNAVESVKKNFKTILLYFLGYLVVFTIVGFISFFFLAIVAAGSAVTMEDNGSTGLAGTGVFGILAAVICISIGVSIKAGLIKIGCQDIINQRIRAYEAITTSLKNIFKIFLLVLTETIMFLPIVFIFYEILKSIVHSFNLSSYSNSLTAGLILPAVVVILFIIILLICLVFMIIFAAYNTLFSFAMQALVIERKGVFGAIKESFYLVRHSYWKIFGINIIIALILLVINISLQSFVSLVGGIIYLILCFFSIKANFIQFISNNLLPFYYLINIVASICVYSFSVFATTNLYFSQRVKKEGFDISYRLSKIKQIERNK